MDQDTFNKKMDALDKSNSQPLRDLLHRAAIKETEDWVSAQYLSARSIGRGGPDLHEGLDKAEKRARDAINALAALSVAAPQVAADERAAFERHIKIGRISYLSAELNGAGEYLSKRTRAAWASWQDRAVLAAAPVQAQEPTFKEVGSFLYVGVEYVATSSDDPRGIKLYRPIAAPVQPVAVPDGGNDTALANKDSIIRFGASLVGHASITDVMDEDELLAWVKPQYDEWFFAPAAPAAQGDAKPSNYMTGALKFPDFSLISMDEYVIVNHPEEKWMDINEGVAKDAERWREAVAKCGSEASDFIAMIDAAIAAKAAS